MDDESSDKCYFTSLPPELIEAVLLQLDDVHALVLVMHCCKTIHSAVKKPMSLARHVWRQSMSEEGARLAITCHLSTRFRSLLLYDVWEVIFVGLQDSDLFHEAFMEMGIGDLLKMNWLNLIVKDFISDFADTAIPLLGGPAKPLSVAEFGRIHRAFYMAELFFTVFRCENYTIDVIGEHERQFFSLHSPWVNEQVACVHDFLAEMLEPAFFEVAAHDIEAGALSIDWLEIPRENRWKQLAMSGGLRFIYRVAHAPTYEDQKALFHGIFRRDLTSLADSLKHSTQTRPFRPEPLYEYSGEALQALARHEDACDADVGPYEAWFRAHRDKGDSRFVFLADCAPLRRMGYVMWDDARLVEAEWWERFDILVARGTGEEDSDTKREGREDMLESFEARSKLWHQGARGYWAPDDHSQIIWPDSGSGSGQFADTDSD